MAENYGIPGNPIQIGGGTVVVRRKTGKARKHVTILAKGVCTYDRSCPELRDGDVVRIQLARQGATVGIPRIDSHRGNNFTVDTIDGFPGGVVDIWGSKVRIRNVAPGILLAKKGMSAHLNDKGKLCLDAQVSAASA